MAIKESSPADGSDSAMIDWMEATGNGLWLNPSTQMWECDDGSDGAEFKTIREAILDAITEAITGNSAPSRKETK